MKFDDEKYMQIIELGSDKVAEFWMMYTNMMDFRNPLHTKWYIDSINNKLNKITVFQDNINQADKILSRARINPGKETLYSNINQLTYPPSEYVSVGRANLPGKSVFYCSNAPGTSVLEVRPKLGEWVTSYEIEIQKENLNGLVVGIDATKNSNFESLNSHDKGINKFLNQIFTQEIKENEKEKYFKTALFVEAYKNFKDCIIYPSVASNAKGYNYLFQKEFIDKYASFKTARVHEIIDFKSKNDFRVECKFIAERINIEGDLEWIPVNGCPKHDINENIFD